MKGRYKPGESGNPKGRPQGATNIITRPLKERLTEFLNSVWDEMPEIWAKLKPREKAQLLRDLLPFELSKMANINVSGEINYKALPEDQLDAIAYKLYNYGKGK